MSDLTGNAATFSDDDTIHWRKNLTEKNAAAAFGRMIRLPMGKMCVSSAKEIWQLPNSGVPTYFIEDINGLNLFRKGECIYRKKDGD